MSRDVKFRIIAEDKSKEGIRSATGALDSLKKAGDKAKNALLGVGVAVAGAVTASVVAATKFETTMSNISTLISGDSTEAIKGLSDGILEMTRRMPKSAGELGASAYDILSAGVKGTSTQLKVLENSAILAVAGLGDTAGATGMMTGAINAFGLEADDADKIADIFFKTVKNGITTVSAMSQAFGSTAPVVAASGISLEEFSAATAALTTTTLPASQAQNGLRQAVISLTKPTEDMQKLFKKLKIESGEAALKTDGLVTTMERIYEAADGNIEILGKAYGSVEALGVQTSLTGEQNAAFKSTLDDMTTGADSVTEAFDKQRETTANNMLILKNNFEELAIKVGERLLPMLNKIVEWIRDEGVPRAAELVESLKNTKQWFNENETAVKTFGIILLGFISTITALKTALAIQAAVATFTGAMALLQAAVGVGAAGTGAAGSVAGLAAVIAALPLAITIGVAVAGVALALAALDSLQKESDKLNNSLDNANNMTSTLITRMHEARAAGDTVRADRLRASLEDGMRNDIKETGPTDGIYSLHRAAGGPVSSHSSYMVGEHGPEVFTPAAAGNITPSHEVGRGGGVSIQNVNINSGMDFGIFKRELSLAVR